MNAYAQDKAAAAATNLSQALNENLTTARKLLDMLIEFLVKYSFQVIGGIVVLIVGWYIAKVAARFVEKFFKKHSVDVTVSKFLVEMLRISIMVLAGLIALGNFGITLAPFIAGLSVAGFGLSFALQGPLSNYAAGATLIFTKPFKVGDIIEVSDAMGEVEDMTLARTQLRTVDGTFIVIPNKHILGEIIHNYSDHKLLEIKIGVSYDSDMSKALAIVKRIVTDEKRISPVPEPKIGLLEFADSSKNIYARVWCKQKVYWDVMFDVNKRMDEEFAKAGIKIPFPQRDVHVIKETQK